MKSQQITLTFVHKGFVTPPQKTVLFTAEYEFYFIYIRIARFRRRVQSNWHGAGTQWHLRDTEELMLFSNLAFLLQLI